MKTRIVYAPEREDLVAAAQCLRSGGLVAFPTETVYGLGGNGLDPLAAKKIYEAKGRPSDNPLILHLYEPEEAEKYAYTCPLYYKLAMAFMPGPLTVILPKKPCVPKEVTGGLDTVALRVPSHRVARALLQETGLPIAAPSANTSGRPSPTLVKYVIEDLDGKVDMILDGGPCDIGLESTIVLLEGNSMKLLRPGGITPEMLAPLCDGLYFDPCLERPMKEGEHPLAPGMKYRHYAPKAQVVMLEGEEGPILDFLRSVKDQEGVGILCKEDRMAELEGKYTFSLGSDLGEEARLLFSRLRAFDELPEVRTIYAPVPRREGIGLAVYNRLAKAAGFTVKKL